MNPRNPAQTFLVEAEDLLVRIEDIALDIQPGEPSGETVNQLFRAFHTLKGSGAMFGFDAVASFTHHVETVLDKVRDGILPVSDSLIQLILQSKDHLKGLLGAAQGAGEVPASAGDQVIAGLQALLAQTTPAQGPPPRQSPPADEPSVAGATVEAPAAVARETFKIRFRPSPGLMVSGTSPVALIDELRSLGDCQVEADAVSVPTLEEIDPDQCYLAWNITLSTDKGINVIRDVFIFVEDGSELTIEPVTPKPSEAPVATPSAAPAVTQTAAHAPSPAPIRKSSSLESTVRVPSERLDRLVNLVGELVMNQSRLTQIAAMANVANLAAPVEELDRLVAELRDNVLGIRMMPIGATFNRFKRLVHDLSAELHKEVDLVTEGAETELDKTVLDQLGDPLVHIIRNCLDHGVEAPEDRARAGKPSRGTVRLTAAHVGSNVVITITDDGKGIDAAAVRAKAIERKLITADATLSETDLQNLVFQPGFSTARQVTSVSGRGVGMDVVRRQIDALRGLVTLTSEQGKGTSIALTLPLTLAIIDGLLVEIAQDRFILPMSAVAENVELPRAERLRHHGRNIISVRGEQVPYIRLRDDFAIRQEETENEKIVIVRHRSDRVGLVVDRVLGSHQTVIQSLGRFYREIDVVSGATIMGDGRVALILDIDGVIRLANRQAGQEPTGLEAGGSKRSH